MSSPSLSIDLTFHPSSDTSTIGQRVSFNRFPLSGVAYPSIGRRLFLSPTGRRSLLRPLRFIAPSSGGISRFKNQLAGVSGNIRACPKAPPDVRAAMLKNLGETSKKNQTLAAQKRSFRFSKTGKNLFELFDSVIKWVGVQNVVQVVTDNVSNYVAAGKMIHSQLCAGGNIYQTPCVAHTVNLVFKDIFALPHIARLAKSASTIPTFLYNHGALLHLLRERLIWKEIVRPGATRFATTFLTIQSILHHKLIWSV
ncbi:hypothetical protein LINPERPRIM_LOCUS22257 [Linum perenne]